jgi:hypothetical protein
MRVLGHLASPATFGRVCRALQLLRRVQAVPSGCQEIVFEEDVKGIPGIPIKAIRIQSAGSGQVVVEVLTDDTWAKGEKWVQVFQQSAHDFLPDEGMVSQIIEAPGITRRYERQNR